MKAKDYFSQDTLYACDFDSYITVCFIPGLVEVVFQMRAEDACDLFLNLRSAEAMPKTLNIISWPTSCGKATIKTNDISVTSLFTDHIALITWDNESIPVDSR